MVIEARQKKNSTKGQKEEIAPKNTENENRGKRQKVEMEKAQTTKRNQATIHTRKQQGRGRYIHNAHAHTYASHLSAVVKLGNE